MEYEIPRLASRIDAVIIASDLIFVIEFKHELNKFELADFRQVQDYALDLNDFHLESRNTTIIPVLVAPSAKYINQSISINPNSKVQGGLKANADGLAIVLRDSYLIYHDQSIEEIDCFKWEHSEYQPTPIIVQAAKALFAGQKVEAISKSDAGYINLSKTSKYLISTIKE